VIVYAGGIRSACVSGEVRMVDPLVVRLRERREALELSQRALAQLIGVGHGHLSRVETGVVDPKLSTLRRLAIALDTFL
jgi:transcriptional regulator with XRE-family HTH domain